jgi:peptidoglycan/xylan/chitin deacetylase (PgdA/CDA1 family)
MTVEQIRDLSASPWATIGCHGYYHNDLAQLSLENSAQEMKRSKQWLETVTGKKIKAIAFPYGSYSKDVVEEAKRTGFEQLLATDFLFETDAEDKTMRERLTINPFISTINQMHANITGHYA